MIIFGMVVRYRNVFEAAQDHGDWHGAFHVLGHDRYGGAQQVFFFFLFGFVEGVNVVTLRTNKLSISTPEQTCEGR